MKFLKISPPFKDYWVDIANCFQPYIYICICKHCTQYDTAYIGTRLEYRVYTSWYSKYKYGMWAPYKTRFTWYLTLDT